jgi:hypothetical protein
MEGTCDGNSVTIYNYIISQKRDGDYEEISVSHRPDNSAVWDSTDRCVRFFNRHDDWEPYLAHEFISALKSFDYTIERVYKGYVENGKLVYADVTDLFRYWI